MGVACLILESTAFMVDRRGDKGTGKQQGKTAHVADCVKTPPVKVAPSRSRKPSGFQHHNQMICDRSRHTLNPQRYGFYSRIGPASCSRTFPSAIDRR